MLKFTLSNGSGAGTMASNASSSDAESLTSGQVNRLRQNWAVHEDGALAQRLQSEEIKTHLHGNRQRNHQIREDVPRARQEQVSEVEEACKQAEERRRMLHEIEFRDAEVARQVQTRLFKDTGTPPLPMMSNGDVPEAVGGAMGGCDIPRRIVYNDEQYQVKLARPALVKDEPVYANNKPEHYAVSTKYPGDRQVGTISKIPAASPRRSYMTHDQNQDSDGVDNVVGMAGLSQRDLVLSQRAEAQLEQQKRDQELARRLQGQLELEEDEDARLAREAQDLEYAKMIHEKDKAKLKRAKERKKLKKQHEQQQQQQFNEVQNRTESRTSGERRSGSHTPQRSFDATPNSTNENLDQHRLVDVDDQESVISAPHPGLKLPARKPYMNTGAIDSHRSSCNNVQQLLDHRPDTGQDADISDLSEPQYANVGPNAGNSAMPAMHIRQTSDDGLPIPPYMPMQQPMSKRSTSLEKRIKKKKEKEGCKQQ